MNYTVVCTERKGLLHPAFIGIRLLGVPDRPVVVARLCHPPRWFLCCALQVGAITPQAAPPCHHQGAIASRFPCVFLLGCPLRQRTVPIHTSLPLLRFPQSCTPGLCPRWTTLRRISMRAIVTPTIATPIGHTRCSSARAPGKGPRLPSTCLLPRDGPHETAQDMVRGARRTAVGVGGPGGRART